MFDFIRRIFGESDRSKDQKSGGQARERLKILLVHDRSSVVAELLPSIKDEIIAVISKYMDVDQAAMEINLTRDEGSVALVANIPVVRWKRRPGFEGEH